MALIATAGVMRRTSCYGFWRPRGRRPNLGERCLPIKCVLHSKRRGRSADEFSASVAPGALARLRLLEERIEGTPSTAARYVDAAVDFCMMLGTFAARGVSSEDLPPELAIMRFHKRAIIAYTIATRSYRWSTWFMAARTRHLTFRDFHRVVRS
jgi:plasmid stabilization system protein ParE